MKYQELEKAQSSKSKQNEGLKEEGLEIKLPMPLIEWLIRQDNI